ncbi:MAG TPA: tripartite tricarboxylate transporter TctB family protein [Burkholderiales bacterium]|nr:tripartite tricarboxylate transporter TctB family protein [Burkholderiales bacterium]
MAISTAAALRLALPLAAGAAAWLLGRYFVSPGVDVDAMARGVVGPATWPRAMLYCAAACALGLFLRNAYAGPRKQGAPGAAGESGEGGYHELRSIAAIALVVAYGLGISQIGFAWSTLAFIAGWLLLGRVRPLLAAAVAVLGTTALLYVFVKLSLMPLDRGRGLWEQATVALYRLLGIY